MAETTKDTKKHLAAIARGQAEHYNDMPLHKLPTRLRKIRESRLLVASDFPSSTSGDRKKDYSSPESVRETVHESLRVRGDIEGGQKTMLGKAVAKGWKPKKKRN